MKYLIRILVICVAITGAYFMGPRMVARMPDNKLPDIQIPVSSVSDYVKEKESHFNIKPDNESVILWGDSIEQPTEYVLLYLHGFSASRYEGYPVIPDFVKEFGCNAYLPRLAEHGLRDKEPLLNMTPDRLYASAKEALVLAHRLGKKVIIMGTSTGCTLALMLAADFPEKVSGLILYSPNIRIKQKMSFLLSGPWGLQIARLAYGGKYRISGDAPDSKLCRYWNCRYRLEAVVYLQQLIDARMTAGEFAKVHVPVFMGYYYKDEQYQDQTVDVKAALRMFDELGTAGKMKVAFPEAGDHVIACELTSGAVGEVRRATFSFARDYLGMVPRN